MKKVLLIIGLICLGKVFAFENDNDFTYSDYEMLCFQYGVEEEINWEQYLKLAENPQCIYDDDIVDLFDY